MAKQPTPKRRGRPKRAEASAKALAGLVVDPMEADPRKVLAAIMMDTSAPAAARVTAAKALLADRAQGDGDHRHNDDINRRALALLNRVAN